MKKKPDWSFWLAYLIFFGSAALGIALVPLQSLIDILGVAIAVVWSISLYWAIFKIVDVITKRKE